MKTTILFPSDYFDINKIDEQFESEYEVVCSIPDFQIVFYNHA